MYTKLRWKGKLVSQAVYNKRQAQSENGKKRKLSVSPVSEEPKRAEAEPNLSGDCPDLDTGLCTGRRVVELSVLGKNLWCVSCKETLSLSNIEGETRRGLGSILTIRCHKCLLLSQVPTGKLHGAADGRMTRFDVNSKLAIGALHAGFGATHVNKVLSCLNVPAVDPKTFKSYEREVGRAMESVAKDSCAEAASVERELTLQNLDKIENMLPDHLPPNFMNPSTSTTNTPEILSSNTQEHVESGSVTATTPKTHRTVLPQSAADYTSFDEVIRIMVSYDMGWSRRGTGRSYDSLNGFGAIIGSMSGLVLDYSTCNRKCKKCDSGRNPIDHDCRLNFWGSAKAMEPHVAQNLVASSSVLSEKNLEVGILVGDDDSSTIAAVRAATSHPVVKFSDVNHAAGGVKKELYKVEHKHGEVNKEAIEYLHRCFTYAMAQNKGDSKSMALAIRSIPHHAFNKHELCGSWCGYIKDRENYDHRIVPGGFHDEALFTDLKKIFNKLADNAEKFSPGASSNVNESLNATMASKAPKARCYSLSESADFRFAASVGQKNRGEGYTQDVATTLGLSPGDNHSKYISRVKSVSARRRSLIRQPEFKKRRMLLKKKRTGLRHRKENAEGVTYESNVGLLSAPALSEDSASTSSASNFVGVESDVPIVLFDLETTGFSLDCDILQIGAICGQNSFSVYIKPLHPISIHASRHNGLTFNNGDLLKNGNIVNSIPLRAALGEFEKFLGTFNKPIILAAHNLSFDGPRLYRAIAHCSMTSDFSALVKGFCDTLPIMREHTKRTGKGECTISGLAHWLSISSEGAHDALCDVQILQLILKRAEVPLSLVLKYSVPWTEQVSKYESDGIINHRMKALAPLSKVVSAELRRKIATADISLDKLLHTFQESQETGIEELFGELVKGKPRVTKHKPALSKIIAWLKDRVVSV